MKYIENSTKTFWYLILYRIDCNFKRCTAVGLALINRLVCIGTFYVDLIEPSICLCVGAYVLFSSRFGRFDVFDFILEIRSVRLLSE